VNVLIAADMEGIAGIDDYGDCLPSHPAAYARGRRLMTEEVLVAIDALREGGVEGISVGDWHLVGTNIERDRMPDGVEVRSIAEFALTEEEHTFATAAGGSLDAIVMIGHHARTSSPRGFCSHTFSWEMEVTLDGEPLSEVQVYAQGLAAEGIPILACSGDRWLLEELHEGELGGAVLVPTKEGEGRARARSYDVGSSRGEIAAAIRAALSRSPSRLPLSRGYPAELRVSLEGEELARASIGEPQGLFDAVATAFRTGPISRDYRQLARLLPPGHDSWVRQAQRRLGGLLATPVMRSKERRWLAPSE
jgi:D-aminopeptidase